MTQNEFRRLALALPETIESAHMGHPDFRVRGKIFATLGYPDESWGMVSLTPSQQTLFLSIGPDIFRAVKGGWGRKGATNVLLRAAKKAILRKALHVAWQNKAPKSFVRK